MQQIIREMSAQVSNSQPFVLATVVTRNGSAPRSAGAKMLVRPDGSIAGTVGGGKLEAEVLVQAAEVMHTHAAAVSEFHFTGADASTMDMICGGRVEVLLEWLDAQAPDVIELVQALQALADAHQKGWLVTRLSGSQAPGRHALVSAEKVLAGEVPEGLLLKSIQAARQPVLLQSGQPDCLVEPVNISGTLYIFGAGHVSRSLANFTQAVGFWTVVVDDRPEFANRQRFPCADQIIVPGSFTAALDGIEIDEDSYIVIVTRGHLHDQTVLAQALKTPAAYIGMIGSRRKCELIFQDLLKNGFTPEDIRRVYAPIGLPIEAETPEEIGVSITAELIKVRAEKARQG
jgi:xanthine dehydrogenase accessory factor